MIWYILVSAILLIYFEIVGRYVLYRLGISNLKCCFGIGIIVFLAYSYITTSLITALNGSFYLISAIYSLFIIGLIVLVIKDRTKISFKFDMLTIILLILFESIMLYYAYNTTLGNLNGFDTAYYVNLVTSNIGSNSMNRAYYINSIEPTVISNQYSFQSYYYVASFVSYICTSLINIIHATYYQTVYVWVFQILFNAFFFSLVINSINIIEVKNKKILTIIFILFFLLVYGRIYYYNVLGFYGNTYRIITVGYSTLILYLLTKSNNNNNLMTLFAGALLASFSVSSSGLFIDIFIMFGAYFILCRKYSNILKYYSFVLFFVLTNLLPIFLHTSIIVSLLIAIVISLLIFIFSDVINGLLSNKKVLLAVLLLSFTFMVVASLLVTKDIFDFSSFFNNHSESNDMTINYFNLSSSPYLRILKIFILLLIISTFFAVKKESFVQFICILFICFFNPFCTPFLYKVLIVYFRAFDIIVNPFTIVLYSGYLLHLFKDSRMFILLFCFIVAFITLQNKPLKPLYYHASFKPLHSSTGIDFENYNAEFKMPQDEKDTIDAIYYDCLYNNNNCPYIVTPSLLTQGFIPNGRFLYCRGEYGGCPYETESEKQLFSIFYPERYKGDHDEKGVKPDYNNIKKYIKEAGIDYLVVDKTKEYYDEENSTYSFLFYKVLEDFYPMLENNRYIVFRCFYQ